MQVEYRDGIYTARVTFEERLFPKQAGFQWDADRKRWITRSTGVALTLGLQNFSDEALRSLGIGDEPPVPEGLEYLNFQKDGIRFASQRKVSLIADQPGLGKAHPISTPILTPTGWKPIGDLQIGDLVIGWDGKPIHVTGIFDRGMLSIFHVKFDDGALVPCDMDHLWTVFHPGEDGGHKETLDTLTLMCRLTNEKQELAVPTLLEPAQIVPKIFDVPPTVVGADIAYLNGTGLKKNRYAYSETLNYNIRDYALCAPHQAIEFLHGLIGKVGLIRGQDRHVRLDIINNRRAADITHTVSSCVRLLGGLIHVEKRYRRLRYRIYLPDSVTLAVFGYSTARKRIRRKWAAFQPGVPPRTIVGIESAGYDQCRCIKVASDDQLYVTQHFVLTHNTIQGVGVMNVVPNLSDGLIIAPASLKKNWLREFKKWTTHKHLSVDICDGSNWPNSNIVIVNYDILHRHHERLREKRWGCIIADEHHYAKNKDSRRTQELHGGVKKVKVKGKAKKEIIRTSGIPYDRLVLLSGTPIATQMGDLWTTVRAADPYGLGTDYTEFHQKWCGGYYDFSGFVPNGETTPETHAELNRIMKERFMIRRLKMDVLTELPEKIRQIVPLPADGLKTKIVEERKAMTDLLDMYEKMVGIRKEMSDEDLVKAMFRVKPETWEAYAKTVDGDLASVQMPLTRLANARQDLAIAKLPMVIEYAGNLIEQGEKVVIFAYHRAVIEGLIQAFPKSAVIFGDTPMESKRHPERTRQAQQDRFQEDASCRSFIGQFTAAGTGWTLTAANHWIGAELTFVPADLLQAEDRIHRIGSEIWDAVWAHHLVVEGSLDDTMVLRLIKRMEIIEQTLD